MVDAYRCGDCGHHLYRHTLVLGSVRAKEWGCAAVGCECTSYKGSGTGHDADQLRLSPFAGVLQREVEILAEVKAAREAQLEERIRPHGVL